MNGKSPRSMADAYAETDASSLDGLVKRKLAVGTVSFLLVLLFLASVIFVAGLPVEPIDTSTPAPSVNATVVVPEEGNYTALYEAVEPSVVSIYANGENGATSQGSGFVYDAEGHIVTNWHVVQEGSRIYVRYSNGEWANATVIGTDPYTDLSVLKVDSLPTSATPLSVAESVPTHGTRVVALGSPDDLRGSLSIGVVSGTDRSMTTPQGFVIPNMIQTDAPLNPGNSGGPLVTMDGSVVGVNRARQGDNIGFAISAPLLNSIVPNLIEDGKHTHSLVGIRGTSMTPTVAEANGIELRGGILVTEVVANGPADGVIQGAGGERITYNGFEVYKGADIIVAVDGHSISTNEALTSHLMRETQPGDSVSFTILRNGETKTVPITLGERPAYGE